MSRTTDAMIAYKECVKQWPRILAAPTIIPRHGVIVFEEGKR